MSERLYERAIARINTKALLFSKVNAIVFLIGELGSWPISKTNVRNVLPLVKCIRVG